MLYAIIGEFIADHQEKRAQARPAHLARLETLRNEGRLILAGPFPAVDANEPGAAGFSGSLIVAEFASLGDAEHWAQTDAYATVGIYQTLTVKPFKKIF
jgi:hypothetical protein